MSYSRPHIERATISYSRSMVFSKLMIMGFEETCVIMDRTPGWLFYCLFDLFESRIKGPAETLVVNYSISPRKKNCHGPTPMDESHDGRPPWGWRSTLAKPLRTMVANHLVGTAMIGLTLNGFGSSWLNPRAWFSRLAEPIRAVSCTIEMILGLYSSDSLEL